MGMMMKLEIKRPTKGVELCLDLEKRSEWEALEADLRDARQSPGGDTRLAGDPVQALAKQVSDLESEMRAATVVFTLTAMNRRDWSRHKSAHAPRKGDKSDEQLGFNEETLFDAVIPASITAVTDPDGEAVKWNPEQWESLADEMTNRQYEDFKVAVLVLNVGDAAARLPKSLSASIVMARSDKS